MSTAGPAGPPPANRLKWFSWALVAVVAAFAFWHSAPSIKRRLTERRPEVRLPGSPQLGFRFRLAETSRQCSLNLRQVALMAQQADRNPHVTRVPSWGTSWLRTCLRIRDNGENIAMISAAVLGRDDRENGMKLGRQVIMLADAMTKTMPAQSHGQFSNINKTAVNLTARMDRFLQTVVVGAPRQ